MSNDWLLPMFACLRKRPGMFLGDERVETLSAFLAGYEQGREDLGAVGMSAHDAALLSGFESWLGEVTKSHGPRGNLGWVFLVRRLDSSAHNVVAFFKLFEEYLETRGTSLDEVKEWVSRSWTVDGVP